MAKVLLEKEVKAAQEDPNLGVSCGQDEEDALKVKVIIYMDIWGQRMRVGCSE